MSKSGWQNVDLYSGVASSAVTSNTQFVGEVPELTIFLRGSPSTTTIQGSNSTLGDTIPTTAWSNLTVITSPGPDLLNIEPGFGHLRCLRSETTEAVLGFRRLA